MTARVEVRGVQRAIRSLRKLGRYEKAAMGAALKKAANAARGQIRREIAGALALPLKATRRRVGWWWKRDKLGLGLSPLTEIKLWVGTAVPVTAKEAASLRRKNIDAVSLRKVAERAVPRAAKDAMGARYARELKSQQARYLARARSS